MVMSATGEKSETGVGEMDTVDKVQQSHLYSSLSSFNYQLQGIADYGKEHHRVCLGLGQPGCLMLTECGIKTRLGVT
jgi:hypothetical protein